LKAAGFVNKDKRGGQYKIGRPVFDIVPRYTYLPNMRCSTRCRNGFLIAVSWSFKILVPLLVLAVLVLMGCGITGFAAV
jgi:hypothetical protein